MFETETKSRAWRNLAHLHRLQDATYVTSMVRIDVHDEKERDAQVNSEKIGLILQQMRNALKWISSSDATARVQTNRHRSALGKWKVHT